MRLQRQKRQEKHVKFYATRFGYRPPFRVILDSAFLGELVQRRSSKALPSLFIRVFGKNQVRTLVTTCTMRAISRKIKVADRENQTGKVPHSTGGGAEVQRSSAEQKRVGDHWRRVSWLARQLELLPCGHPKHKELDPGQEHFEADCIQACVERGPETAQQAGLTRSRGRFAVAALDSTLRSRLKATAGTMLLQLAVFSGGLHVQIEPPSTACLQEAREQHQRVYAATPAEVAAAHEAQRALQQSSSPAASGYRLSLAKVNEPAAASELQVRTGELGTNPDASRALPDSANVARVSRPKRTTKLPWMDAKTNITKAFKRNKSRGPNPLSRRKPQRKT
jgi:hypothetical protein